MHSGQAPERTDGRSKLTPEQLEHLRNSHLTIFFNKERDTIEIGWVCKCQEKDCHAPHTTVAFYTCPSKPCPPGHF